MPLDHEELTRLVRVALDEDLVHAPANSDTTITGIARRALEDVMQYLTLVVGPEFPSSNGVVPGTTPFDTTPLHRYRIGFL